jgi:aminoglycoside phosphotransferase (APT) family kinase protein
MPVKIKATVLAADCAGHPAVIAWAGFSGRRIVPPRIEVLRTGLKSSTYRLFGVGPAGTSIIGQCSRARKAAIERIVYEDILPHLPVTVPRFYGVKPEGTEHTWMFLEDVGDQRYQESDPVHRSLAGRWVGLMHSAAGGMAAARALSDTGPERYFRYLQTACRTIRSSLADPTLAADDADLLARIAADLEALESDWPAIERACADMPVSLAHGDFRPKNALLRQGPDGLGLYPIDWETAGWGVPAADLTRIDLAAYHSVVQASWWRGARIEDVERVAAVGAVFRYLSSIYWLVPELAAAYKPIPCLRVGHRNLTSALQKLRAITGN